MFFLEYCKNVSGETPGKAAGYPRCIFLFYGKFTVSGRKGRPQRSLSMKKTVLCIVLAAAMLFAACSGNSSGGNSADSTSTVSATPAPIPSDFNFSPNTKLTDCMPGQWKALKEAYDAGAIDHVEYFEAEEAGTQRFSIDYPEVFDDLIAGLQEIVVVDETFEVATDADYALTFVLANGNTVTIAFNLRNLAVKNHYYEIQDSADFRRAMNDVKEYGREITEY